MLFLIFFMGNYILVVNHKFSGLKPWNLAFLYFIIFSQAVISEFQSRMVLVVNQNLGNSIFRLDAQPKVVYVLYLFSYLQCQHIDLQ